VTDPDPAAETSEVAMIELRKLTKSFGSKYALRGVSLRVMPGESLVIFGPNGAGKSTLIRILSSLSRPTSGTVHIGGLDLATHADGIRRHLGVVSHAPLLYDSLTAEENLRFFAGLYGMSQPEPRIALLLAQVGLTTRRGDLVRTFSRGMVQRLAIARALLHDPEVLLLDEPDTGLDPQAAEMLHDLLVQVSRGAKETRGRGDAETESGGTTGQGVTRPDAGTPTPSRERTLVTVTHSLERGLAIADRMVILANGRLVFEADARGMTAADFRPLYDQYVGGGR
jgi:heme exporter protein A